MPARWFLSARKEKTTERAWAAVMYQAATTGIKERRSSVIMAWGHRPWLSQTSKHERRCVLKATGASNSLQLRSCMLPSFLAKQATTRMEQKTKKKTQPQNKERKVALGGVELHNLPREEVLLPHLCPTWLLSLSGYSYQYQRHTQQATGPVATSLPHMAPVPPSGYSCQYLD